MRNNVFLSVLLVLSTNTMALAAETPVKGTKAVENSNQPVVTVNKIAITEATFVDVLKARVASGAKDSQQLRQSVLDDLVVTEVLAQQASKAKLNSDAEVKRAIENAQRKILAEAYLLSQLKSNPVTDADAKAEYDRQIALTKEGRNSVEYKASQIVVKDESTAQAVMKRLNAGEDFAKVAKEVSLDQDVSKSLGALPWSLPDQFIKPLGDVVSNLLKGKLSTSPVQSAIGWHIIKLDDSRPFKAPSFEESKQRMMQTLVERRKQEIIQQAMSKSEIKGQ
jgi:peptidyl-prolyl cis-trans isomerase C